jgi:hypothetical protein
MMLFSSNVFRFFVLVVVAAFHAVFSTAIKEVTVDLETAADFVILAETGITNVPDSAITGDIGVSPITGDAMTFFTFTKVVVPGGSNYATSAQLKGGGRAYASDSGGTTEGKMTTAVADMRAAYFDATGRSTDDAARNNLGAGILGGGGVAGGANAKLTPGVYTFSTGVYISDNIYFEGTGTAVGEGDTDIFIIQTAGNMVMAANKMVVLTNGALAENIFWQVAGYVQVGAGAHLEGILLAKTAVTFITGSTLNGRILAQTLVALQMATITEKPVATRRSLLRKGV